MTGRGRSGFPDYRVNQAKTARLENIKLVEKLRATALPCPTEVPERFRTALRDIELRYADSKEALPPAEAYCQLAEAIERVARTRRSEALLCWPAPNIAIAAGFALSVMATWSDCDPLPTGQGLARPEELRGLYFPWSLRTRLPLSGLYVSKDQVHKIHLRHLQRYALGGTADGFGDLHVTLIRVKDLNGRARDGTYHIELEHPSLYELVPSRPCGSSGEVHVTTLLDRVRNKTQLRELRTSRLAERADTAPYHLFGARARSLERQELDRLPERLGIALLDLTRTGRNRLSEEWQRDVAAVIRHVRAKAPEIPILAVSDDPWVHREIIWRLLKTGSPSSDKRPAPEAAVLVTDHLIAKAPQPTLAYSGCERIVARGFAGGLHPVLDRIQQLKARAKKIEDRIAEAQLSDLAALLRRCANLPGGVGELGSYVVQEAGEEAAIHIMAAYQAPKLLADIERLEGPLAQSRRGQLTELGREARSVWDAQVRATPMSGLLVDVLKPFLRNSSRTVVLFRKQMLCDYAEAALVAHPEVGEAARKRLDNRMLRFVDAIGFKETSGLPPRERHQTTTAILVSPTRQQVLALMAEPWLPTDLIVLADAGTLAAIARDAAHLATLPAFAGLVPRLQKLKAAAHKEAEAISRVKVLFTPDIAPPPDAEFPTTKIIDLSGSSRSSDEILVRLETDDSQTILARKRTRLISFDDTSAVPIYRPVAANDTEIGDAICVITDDFIDMARTRLDIAHAACEEMRSYHHLVRELYGRVPGGADRAKRAWLAEQMNRLGTGSGDEVAPDTVRYWVDLDEQLALPLEEVTPHAPQQRATFDRFMMALGVPNAIAERYWHWAVIHTRSNRLRAAHRLHDAYLGILVAPHAAEAENPKRVADIRALRAAAEGFVSRIRSKATIERASLCVS